MRVEPVLELVSNIAAADRKRMALRDIEDGLRLWRLGCTLGWLDIKLRYRGSLLGPLWLTLSTAVMVGGLGILYSTLFKTSLRDYLPFLALSMVLWNTLSGTVADACVCFTSAEGLIRSARLPFTLYAIRMVVRNVLVLGHNIVVIIAVYALLNVWPGWYSVAAIPALALWLVNALAAGMFLGAFCARFRDIPPIVASVVQIAFFMSPVLWKPDAIHGTYRVLMDFNPFFTLLEVVRGPMLGYMPPLEVWVSAIFFSGLLCALAWMMFMRVRGRLAFWV
jgi:lipopolysaccharide transport system permease protein